MATLYINNNRLTQDGCDLLVSANLPKSLTLLKMLGSNKFPGATKELLPHHVKETDVR